MSAAAIERKVLFLEAQFRPRAPEYSLHLPSSPAEVLKPAAGPRVEGYGWPTMSSLGNRAWFARLDDGA